MSLKKQNFFTAIFIFLSVAALVAAPVRFSLAAGLVPCGGTGQNPCTVLDAFALVAIVTNWLIAMAGLYAVYKIVGHGFWLVVSMGNEENITTHKAGLTDAVLGFVLVMLSFMFINTVVNFLLTRDAAVHNNPNCKLDLTNPTAYLVINQNPCSNLPEPNVHYTP